MKPVSPVIDGIDPSNEIVFGANQPGVQPLPVLTTDNGAGIVSRWVLTDEELEEITRTRSVYLHVWKPIRAPLQPVLLVVQEPETKFPKDNNQWPEIVDESPVEMTPEKFEKLEELSEEEE